MSTSANVRKYKIYHNGKIVGGYHINLMCKIQYQPLLKYTPTSEHTIIEYWYDEDEEYHEKEEVRLDKFLDKVLPKINLNPTSHSWRYQLYKNNPTCKSWISELNKNNKEVYE
jgi:hypothetical protein